MPGADCGNDHMPVVATMKIKLKKTTKENKTAPKAQLNMLEKDEMMNKYSINLKNKFSGLEQLIMAEERWQMMKENMLESAKEHIPVTKRKWMTSEILDFMEERRKAKSDEQKYRELDNQVEKKCNEAKEHWINTQCEEIEANKVNSKTVHQKIKEVTGKKVAAKTGCIQSKDGDILMEKENILNRWSEYITELYHDDIGHQLSSIMMKAPKFFRRKFKRPSKI